MEGTTKEWHQLGKCVYTMAARTNCSQMTRTRQFTSYNLQLLNHLPRHQNLAPSLHHQPEQGNKQHSKQDWWQMLALRTRWLQSTDSLWRSPDSIRYQHAKLY